MLGWGLVPGSLVLIGGDPGIGKSTLLLQVSALLSQAGGIVVYVSGEETLHQTKLRAGRLGVKGERLYLLSETNLDVILSQIEKLHPCLVVVDSIQSICLPELETAPGSITQVRECTLRLMHWAKPGQVPVFITRHVTKDRATANVLACGILEKRGYKIELGRYMKISVPLTVASVLSVHLLLQWLWL